MSTERRDFLQFTGLSGVLAAIGMLVGEPAAAQRPAWNKSAFEAKSRAEAVKALGGSGVAASADIMITGPDIAEDGALVPVGVASKLPGTHAVYILVDKNPNWLASAFAIPASTEANITIRVKMNQTSNVIGLVKANNQFFMAAKEVKVSLGGCGG